MDSSSRSLFSFFSENPVSQPKPTASTQDVFATLQLTYLSFPTCDIPDFNSLSNISDNKTSSITLQPHEVINKITFDGRVEVRMSGVQEGGRGCYIFEYKGLATGTVPRSTIVGMYGGTITPYQPLLQYAIGLEGISKMGHSYCVDAKSEGNEFRFANYHHHSNTEFVEVYVQGFNGGIVCVQTTCDMNVGDEIFMNYATNYTTLKEKNSCELCDCGASFCTGYLGFRGGSSSFSTEFLQQTSSITRVQDVGSHLQSHADLTFQNVLLSPPSPFKRGKWSSTLQVTYHNTNKELLSAKEYFYFDPRFMKTIVSVIPSKPIPHLVRAASTIPVVCLIGFFELHDGEGYFAAFHPLVPEGAAPFCLSSPSNPPKVLRCVNNVVFLFPLKGGHWLPILDQVCKLY